MIQLQPSHIASLWKLCVGSDKRWRWHTKTAMSTSVEGAADADDGVENLVVSDPVIGEWTDSYTNAYTITGTNGRYSVTVTYKQDCKRHGQTEHFKDIINRDGNGDYIWGCTHKLCILENGRVEWRTLIPGKIPWLWTKKTCQHSFRPNETSLSVPMSELQARLRLCLGSTLTRELRS